jgi:hypothetical protein
MKAVNRLLGAFLVCVFSFLLIVPAFPTSLESQLPACCRTNGKHKCAMGLRHSTDSGANVIQATCPYSGRLAMPAASSGKGFVLGASAAFYGFLISHPAQHAQVEARGRISFSRTRQKRGPPSRFL